MVTATRQGAGAPPAAGGPATRGSRSAGTVPRPRPRPGSGRIGPLRVQQVVLIEVAAALLLLAWVTHPLMVLPACVPAAALLLLAVVQRRHRPVAEWLLTAMEARARKRGGARPLPAGTDPGFAPAAECDPSLRTMTYTDRSGKAVGMVGDGTFLTAVLQVEAADVPLRPLRTARPLPLDVLYGGLEVDGIRVESVQIVQHTQPAPAPHLPAQAVAVRNYAPLQARSGAAAVRLTWVAVKLDPQLCPEAVAARGGGLGGAQRCLLRAANQLANRLTGEGFRVRVLTEAELSAAVATSSCASPRATEHTVRTGAAPRRTAENARSWRCDDRWHTTYWIGRWPRLGPGAGGTPVPNLVALLTSMPTLASTFSLTARRGLGDQPELTGHLRITSRSDSELVAARKQVERAAHGVKVELVRLDREQVPGVLATLPLGGAR
jgi:type VII secretion protein EccE